jgi:putative FmdB family regulatory protein
MPTYEYACKECGEHLEVVQSFRDDPLTQCPACGGDLRKVFGSIGVVFKGSGFYKTDSRSTAKTAKGAKDSATTTESSKDAKESSVPSTAGSEGASSSSSGDKGSSSGNSSDKAKSTSAAAS